MFAAGSVSALLLVVGAYLLGAAIGDNGDAVRAESRAAYAEGFDEGRRRGYRATYENARSRAEQAATDEQASAAPPETPPTQAAPDPPDSPAEDSGTAATEEESDSSGLEPCVYGEGLCTPEENARENEAESICGGGGPEAEARPDLCGPGE